MGRCDKLKYDWQNHLNRRKLFNRIISEFPENFKDLIDEHSNSIKDCDIRRSDLKTMEQLLLNIILNYDDRYSNAELKYVVDVRKHVSKMYELEYELFKNGNLKGNLTKAQMEKYGDGEKLSEGSKLSGATKPIFLISVGLLNLFHGAFHIIQFIQSMFFVAYATHEHNDEGIIESIMHNPVFALAMGVIGILTLVIGVRDYKHHKKCDTNN